jgi:hypothetical protein
MPPSASACQASLPVLATSPQARTAQAHVRRPRAAAGDPSGAKARPCGCTAPPPVARKDRKARDRIGSLCQKSLCVSSVRSVSLWWDRQLYGYNYQLIVIAKTERHYFPKSSARKNAPSGGQQILPSGPTGLLRPPSASLHACGPAWLCHYPVPRGRT